MKLRIEKINVKDWAKISGAFGLIIGIFMGVIYGLIAGFTAGWFWGILVLIGVPFGYGLLSYAVGAGYAWVFNFMARRTGGIRIECSREKTKRR